MKSPKTQQKASTKRRPPARTPEQREQQMISYAMNLAEQQLIDGTASAQVITHFLKLATVRETYERKNLETDVELKQARIKEIDDKSDKEMIAQKAIEAMTRYRMD